MKILSLAARTLVCSGVALSALLPVRADAPTSTPYSWKNVAIVGGGFVTGIIFSPAEKGLMYARTDIGGAYRWDKNGKRWIPLTDWVKGPNWNWTGIESIGVDPTDANRVYMAVGTYTNDWAGNGAILRSTDRGAHWQRTDMPFKMGGNMDGRFAGERLAVDPHRHNLLFFGSRDNGLWQSGDFGATWKSVASLPVKKTPGGVGIAFVLFDGRTGEQNAPTRTLYAGVSQKEDSLFRSTDGGATWQPVPGTPGGFLPNHGVLASDGWLYLSYGDAPGPNGMSDGAVWKLNTRTGEWVDISPLKPSEGDRFGYGGVTVDARHPNGVMASTMDRWAKHDDIFRSTDGGRTWKSIGAKAVRDASLSPYLTWGRPTADLGHWLGDIDIDPFDSGHVLYVTGATIWATNDANAIDADKMTHWYVGANGLEETVILSLASPPSGAPLLSAMGDINGFRHENLSVSPRSGFFQPSHGTGNDIDFAELKPNIVARTFGGSRQGAFSQDNGKTWTEFPEVAGARGGGNIAVSANGESFVMTADRSVPKVSRDRGMTWTNCTGLPKPLRVVSDRADTMRFYAFDRDSGTVSVSRDGGTMFVAGASDLPKADGVLRAVPGKAGHVFLASEKGLYRSVNAGQTFSPLPGLERASRVGFGKAAPGQDYPAIYAVGAVKGMYGIYRSDDLGARWVRINDDAHQFAWINAITGDPRVYGRVYLGSASRGILYGEPRHTK